MNIGGKKMKTINVTFTDDEHEKLVEAKEAEDMNWHDFILINCKIMRGVKK